MLTLDELLELMREIEDEDGLDFADLPIAEDTLRRLVASDLLARDQALRQLADGDEVAMIYLISAAHLVLENLLLHLRLLRMQQVDSVDEAQLAALLQRLRRRAGGE